MDTSLGQNGIELYFPFPQGRQLLARMTGFTLPCVVIFTVCLYPSTYFPLFITSWNLELNDCSNFLSSLRPPSSCLRCKMAHRRELLPRWLGSKEGKLVSLYTCLLPLIHIFQLFPSLRYILDNFFLITTVSRSWPFCLVNFNVSILMYYH